MAFKLPCPHCGAVLKLKMDGDNLVADVITAPAPADPDAEENDFISELVGDDEDDKD